MSFMSIFASPCPKVATKCAKLGCSDRLELDVDMVDQAEATPGLSGALLAASLACVVRRALGRCTCRRYTGAEVGTFHAPFAIITPPEVTDTGPGF